MSLLAYMKSSRPSFHRGSVVHLLSFLIASLLAGAVAALIALLPRWVSEHRPLLLAMQGSPVIPISGLLLGVIAVLLRRDSSGKASPSSQSLAVYSLSALGWSAMEPFRDWLWALTSPPFPSAGQAVLAWSIGVCKPVLLPAAVVALWLSWRRVSWMRVVSVVACSCLLSAFLFLMTSTHLWVVILRGYELQWIVPFGNLPVPVPYAGAALTLFAAEALAPGRFRGAREDALGASSRSASAAPSSPP